MNVFFILNQTQFFLLKDIETINTTENLIMVFLNPSNILNQPGWPLRNLLAGIAYLKYYNFLKSLKIYFYLDQRGKI